MKIPLVLLTGLLSNKRLWIHQVSHLSDIADPQIISCAQDTPQKMIQAILDEAPPKFALAGHSMGGWLCLEIMKTAKSRVKKLCLLNTPWKMDSEEKKILRQKWVHKAEKGNFRDVVKEILENFVVNPVMKSDVEKMFLEVGIEAFINQEKAMIARSECQSVLPSISCPTLAIHAMQDTIASLEEHRELTYQIPDAKLALVEDSGHMSPLEMPQAITSLMRFWLTYF